MAVDGPYTATSGPAPPVRCPAVFGASRAGAVSQACTPAVTGLVFRRVSCCVFPLHMLYSKKAISLRFKNLSGMLEDLSFLRRFVNRPAAVHAVF